MVMTQKDKEYICAVIENEGFEYAFASYSNFEQINDEEFHEARKQFLEARKHLMKVTGYDEL
jgi:hypothetical protein